MTEAFDYEAQREENIRKNKELLASLGLSTSAFSGPATSSLLIPQAASKSKKRTSTGRKKSEDEGDYDESAAKDEESDDEEPVKKAPKRQAPSRPSLGTRRSARHEGKPVINYNDEGGPKAKPLEAYLPSGGKKRARKSGGGKEGEFEIDDNGERPRDRLGKRTQNPCTFGHIPGVPVGKTWELRYVLHTAVCDNR